MNETSYGKDLVVKQTAMDSAVQLLRSCRAAMVVSHIRPDGDSVGSMRAVCEILEAWGKRAYPLLLSPLPAWYDFVFERAVPVLGNDVTMTQLGLPPYSDCDLLVIVDTNSVVQLPGLEPWLVRTKSSSSLRILVIDHHVTQEGLGDVEVIDNTAAATGQIIYELVRHAKLNLTKPMATGLFVAIATDTGWFRYGSTNARLLREVAELVDAGAEPSYLYRQLYQQYSPSRLKLMCRMLETLELHFNQRVAVQTILRRDFDETGSTGRDTENLIDECQRIGTVEVAVLLVELGDDETGRHKGFRCSLRSKGRVDVRKIAQKYGGGGHTMASGVNLAMEIQTAKKAVLDEIFLQINP